MTTSEPNIPILPSISTIASRYDAWLCDVWGVMHNGVHAFEAAVGACRSFRQQGGTVLLLTNAPRPDSAVATQLDGFGVARDAYDGIVTSGDLTRHLISARPDRLFHLGPARDLGIFSGLDLNFADEQTADVLVCTGLLDDNVDTPATYTERFQRFVDRGAPMICANPDLTVERGERLVYCAGSLAAEYERLGGEVIYAGKPHLPIYDLALSRLTELRGGDVRRERILAIGDGMRTDMRGAVNADLDSVFIASAIHVTAPLDDAQLKTLFADSKKQPVAAMSALAW